MAAGMCPRCKKPRPELVPVNDVNLKTKLLAEMGRSPETICTVCLSEFNRQKGKGVLAKTEQQRIALWRNRVNLIKDARERFARKDFGGAAVGYEKYIKVLETIYEKPITQITHKDFGQGRAKELTVVASVYWDLIRIYDQSPQFRSRAEKSAKLLVEYLPHSQQYEEISRKIVEYRALAKNRDLLEMVAKKAKRGKSRCFIATASFQSVDAEPVQILCEFRDKVLENRAWGRTFISIYYKVSPPIASVIDLAPPLQKLSQYPLSKIAKIIDRKYHLKRPPY